MGGDSRGGHARRSHDAGIHFLEPVDRHGNAALLPHTSYNLMYLSPLWKKKVLLELKNFER